MIVVPPFKVTDAILNSSNIAEPSNGEVEWVTNTAYAIGDIRIRKTTHRRYRAKAAVAATATTPENDAANWQDIGPTNKWAMFEVNRSTASINAAAVTLVLTPGQRTDSLFIGNSNATQIKVTINVPGTADPVYTRTLNRIARRTTSWKTYFFGKFKVLPSLLLADLPPITNAVITIELTNTFGGNISLATVVIGNQVFIGNVQKKATSDWLSASTADRDTFTEVVFVPRRTIPRTEQTLELKKGFVNQVREVRVALDAKVAVWSGLDDMSDDGYFESLLILGFPRRFLINLDEVDDALVQLELEEV